VSIESQDKLDHVLLLFKRNGYWLGSLVREPAARAQACFRSVRDLVMSYFDPYRQDGRITGYGWSL
jgi:hypothetical protein